MTNNPNEPTPQPNPFEDLLKTIKNEDGEQKFQNVEDALKSVPHKDQHISRLEGETSQQRDEIARLTAELETRKSVEQALEALQTPQAPPATPVDPPKEAGLSQEQVQQMMQETLQKQANDAARESNLSGVLTALSERFGDNQAEALQKVVASSGLTAESFKEMAMTNPQVVKTLLATVPTDKAPKPTTPSSQLTSATPKPGESPPSSKNLITGGASTADLLNEWRQIQTDVHTKWDIQT